MPGTLPAFASGHLWLGVALLIICFPFVVLAIYTVVVSYLFLPTMMRIFEEPPHFVPPREPPDSDAENVRFQAGDGLWLQGSWLPATAGEPRGTVVFCHEYLSNRWSCRPYCEVLRVNGYNIFTFDFRNSGESESLSTYRPVHWATNHEVMDLRAALAHVRSRTDMKTDWIGLFGISRGGNTAILTAAIEPCVQAVVTDGAFPTNLTQVAYMVRWAKIYVGEGVLYQFTPAWYYSFFCGVARYLSGRRHGCRFLRVARVARLLAPRRLLMIHGERDSYIVPEVAKQLYQCASDPKEFWLVPGAKHNASIHVAGERYRGKLLEFFLGE